MVNNDLLLSQSSLQGTDGLKSTTSSNTRIIKLKRKAQNAAARCSPVKALMRNSMSRLTNPELMQTFQNQKLATNSGEPTLTSPQGTLPLASLAVPKILSRCSQNQNWHFKT